MTHIVGFRCIPFEPFDIKAGESINMPCPETEQGHKGQAMTPIEKLISDLKEIENVNFQLGAHVINRLIHKSIVEYESAPKPIELPVEIDVEFKDGDWLTVDSDGSGEKHICEPEDSPSFGGCWTSEGGRFFAIFKTPDDWKKARWQLVDGKWVQK